MQSDRDILFLFNLELDLESEVLAVAHDWVEEFALTASKIYVFSTHVGSTDLPENVVVAEIGGGNLYKKIRGLSRLLRLIPMIVELRKRLVVFHHMSPRTALILGPVFRVMGVPQGLWYSHSHKSPELVISSRIVDKLFSSTPQALPIKSKKSVFVGHGIPVRNFVHWREKIEERNLPMVSVGRLAPIKKYESGISLVRDLATQKKQFIIIGPGNKFDTYSKSLLDFAQKSKVELVLFGPRKYLEIPDLLCKSNYFYSGTPRSVDKAAIEAALSGAFVLSENRNTMQLTGMLKLIGTLGLTNDSSLQKIVSAIESLDPVELQDARSRVSAEAEHLSNLSNTCRLIIASLQGKEH